MSWLTAIHERLAAELPCGYHFGHAPSTEPTALAALALLKSAPEKTSLACDWLASLQDAEGRLGISATENSPYWPTAWGAIAWSAAASPEFAPRVARALDWIAQMQGQPMHSVPELGHDATLVGWPWVEGTHSWIEPTALALLALKASGRPEHARAREAARLLYDRQLPSGGWNYGNTFVLGQELLSHVQPSGLVLLALAGEDDRQQRLKLGLRFLRENIGPDSSAASLAYGVMGLAAHGERPAVADEWLARSAARVVRGDKAPYKLALLALAAIPQPQSWLWGKSIS